MLTPRQSALLRAAADRIIPADDYPGAWEAGAGDYLLGQFRRDLEPLLDLYRDGLDALDAEARADGGAGFVERDAAAQDALLARVERGAVAAAWPTPPAAFFRRLVEHVAEGYYSDPGNGGNKDGIAWKMVGFEVSDAASAGGWG